MNEVVKKKLKLLDLSKNYSVTKKLDSKNQEYYYIEDTQSDIYANVYKDGKIEYWGYTGEYYDFKIDIKALNQLVDFVEILTKE